MERSIVLSKRYLKKTSKLLIYLQTNWGNKVAKELTIELDRRILQLTTLPDTGKPAQNYTNTRSILISKHNRLVYRFSETHIVIINLIDTRQKSASKKY